MLPSLCVLAVRVERMCLASGCGLIFLPNGFHHELECVKVARCQLPVQFSVDKPSRNNPASENQVLVTRLQPKYVSLASGTQQDQLHYTPIDI